jgi:hypothetical protein
VSGNLSQTAGVDGCVTPTGAAVIHGASVPGNCLAYAPATTNGQMTFVDDGSFIAGSYAGWALMSFKRDFYPTCQSQSYSVTTGTAAPLAFACSDRNSGDALQYEITANPVSGILGAVDHPGARVFYNPFGGFAGTDSFRYRALSAGLPSGEATASINVVGGAAPPPPPQPQPQPGTPKAPTPTVNSGATWEWSVVGSKLRLKSMTIRNLPAKATITFACLGSRCPFKTKTVKRGSKSTMNVVPGLKGKNRFRAKQIIDVRIAAPNQHTKVLRFKLAAGKIPKGVPYCTPLGSTRVQRTC